MPIRIISVHNASGGDYIINFDTNVTDESGGATQPGMLLRDATLHTFRPCTILSQFGPHQLIIQQDNGQDDCDMFIMWQQPTGIAGDPEFELLTPTFNVAGP